MPMVTPNLAKASRSLHIKRASLPSDHLDDQASANTRLHPQARAAAAGSRSVASPARPALPLVRRALSQRFGAVCERAGAPPSWLAMSEGQSLGPGRGG